VPDQTSTLTRETASSEIDELAAEEEAPVEEPSLGKRFFNAKTLISFLFGFAILFFLVTRVEVNVDEIKERVSQANVPLLVLAFLIYYASFPVRALRWRVLLGNVGFGTRAHPLPSLPILSEFILLSWFANSLIPAKLGDAYRAFLLRKSAGVSFSRTIGTILAERIMDMLVLFSLLVAAASLTFGQALPPYVVGLMQGGLAVAVVVIGALVGMKNLRPLVERLLPARLHEKYHLFEEGTLHSFRRIPPVLVLTLAVWACEVGRLYLVTTSLGFGGADGVKPSVILFVALASALATAIPGTPAGLGLVEGAIVTLFMLAADSGLAPGMDQHAAFGIAVLDRGISYGSLLVIGLIAYLVSHRK
jgi:uncharacterized protein (TIRG00374 family)